MRNAKEIVRTITTESKGEYKHYYIEFMTFEKFVSNKENGYTWYNHTFEIYPYKWFDLRWIYEIPSYWFLLRIFRNSEAKINKQTHNKASIITLITEMLLATKPIIELTKFFINK